MRNILRANIIYIGLCLMLLVALGIVLLYFPKADLHVWMNACHTPFLDTFFRYYTEVGEWVPYVVVVALLFYRFGWSAFLLANIAISGLIGQGLKYLFDTPRPLTYFAEHYPDVRLQLVDGVHMSAYYSFPSGHTITFFAFFFTLSLFVTRYLSEKKSGSLTHQATKINTLSAFWQIFFFLCALLGAYSRIYLSQHFAEDIWGGVLIGLTVSLLFCSLLPLISDKKWYKMHFFEKKLQKNLEH